MIAILDYGLGNLFSVQNMLKHIDVESIITGDHEQIRMADKLILPGVGSFDEGMDRLNRKGLTDLIKQQTLEAKKPLLGICLGMQLLGRRSEEGKEKGLSLIAFDSVRFSFTNDRLHKVPHMGWERVIPTQNDCGLTKELVEGDRFYFVHSYHALCDNKDNEILSCEYGYPFTAAVWSGNIYGVQFHPEKSHRFGMKLLKSFAEL